MTSLNLSTNDTLLLASLFDLDTEEKHTKTIQIIRYQTSDPLHSISIGGRPPSPFRMAQLDCADILQGRATLRHTYGTTIWVLPQEHTIHGVSNYRNLSQIMFQEPQFDTLNQTIRQTIKDHQHHATMTRSYTIEVPALRLSKLIQKSHGERFTTATNLKLRVEKNDLTHATLHNNQGEIIPVPNEIIDQHNSHHKHLMLINPAGGMTTIHTDEFQQLQKSKWGQQVITSVLQTGVWKELRALSHQLSDGTFYLRVGMTSQE